MFRAQMWRWMVQESIHICKLHDGNGGDFHSGQPVPYDYALAVGSLQTLIKNCVSQQMVQLERIMQALPGFQRDYEYRDGPYGTEVALKKLSSKWSTGMTYFNKDPLFWAVWQLHQHDIRYAIEPKKSFYFTFNDDHLAASTTTSAKGLELTSACTTS